MTQVLDASEIRDEEFTFAADDSEYPAPPSYKRKASWWRLIMSIFTRPQAEYVFEYANLTEEQEGGLDRVCRTDPYLFIRAISS